MFIREKELICSHLLETPKTSNASVYQKPQECGDKHAKALLYLKGRQCEIVYINATRQGTQFKDTCINTTHTHWTCFLHFYNLYTSCINQILTMFQKLLFLHRMPTHLCKTIYLTHNMKLR